MNAKLTRAKADGMQTPAAESCIQDDLVVFPDPLTQGRLCLTATHIVEEFLKCAQAGMNDNPDLQLISRICGILVDLSTWFDQARDTTAEQRCLAAYRNLLGLKEECIRGCVSDVRGRLERDWSVSFQFPLPSSKSTWYRCLGSSTTGA